MKIQKANISSDLNGIVQLHIKVFPNFFMTNMGNLFLKEYYQALLEYPKNISLVAVQNDQVVGFIVGFGDPPLFYKFYRQRYKRLIIPILLAIIQKPKLISRTFFNFRRTNSVKAEKYEVEMSSIAVNPLNKGIGHLLVDNFIEIARQERYSSIYLTTDKENNYKVNSFYQKQGFFLEKTFLSDQRTMNLYRLILSNNNTSYRDNEKN